MVSKDAKSPVRKLLVPSSFLKARCHSSNREAVIIWKVLNEEPGVTNFNSNDEGEKLKS